MRITATGTAAMCEQLDAESDRQRRFREDMRIAGIEMTLYSGRGMYGEYTYSVYCHPTGGITGSLPTEQEVYRATSVKLSRDSMGKGSVLYVSS